MRMSGLSRRSVVETVACLLATTGLEDDSSNSKCVDIICRFTPLEFRSAVRQSSSFLYRGEDLQQPLILHPDPDLLTEGTYSDPLALEYFTCLENRLQSSVAAKPSTGHIGTANFNDAAQWGGVVSVWPLGSHLSYVYPSGRDKLFFPPGDCKGSLAIDNNLDAALSTGREVLFASWFDPDDVRNLPFAGTSAFLAVPSACDAELKKSLLSCNYGI